MHMMIGNIENNSTTAFTAALDQRSHNSPPSCPLSVSPQQAFVLQQAGQAVIVDIRTEEERHFVGHVPDSLHVAWAYGTQMLRNPRFLRELEFALSPFGGKQAVALLLCRSGQRSRAAQELAMQAGFAFLFTIDEGFEGDANTNQQRGYINGWRQHGLPWIQN